MTRATLACCLLLTVFAAGPAHADSTGFTQLLEKTAKSPTRTLTFFQGLAGLKDFDLKEAALKKAITDSKVPTDGLLGAFLTDLKRFRKKGTSILIEREKQVVEDTGSGVIKLGKKVKFNLSAGKRSVTLSKVKDVRAGKGTSLTVPVRKLKLTADEDDITTATLNVGYRFANSDKVIRLVRKPGLAGHLPQ